MSKEFRVGHDAISDPQTVTQVTKRLFKDHDVDTSKNEALDIIDDPSKRQRIYKIKNTKFFGPWSHRG